MKNKLLYLFLLFSVVAGAQIVNIPDIDLKNKLLQANYNTQIAKNSAGQYFKIDSNYDGEIQLSEALEVHELNVSTSFNSNSQINSFEGIQYFTNIRVLWCDNSNAETLNVSDLLNLTEISCQYGNLSSLIITGLSNLKILNCRENNISQLNLTGCINLSELDCQTNQLVSLDLSPVPGLTFLDCDSNQLTELNVTMLTGIGILIVSHNQLTSFDLSAQAGTETAVSYNPDLKYLNLKSGNASKPLIVGQIPNLDYICADEAEIEHWEALLAESNVIGTIIVSDCALAGTQDDFLQNTSLSLYPNPTNGIVNIKAGNTIKSIELFDIQGRLLQTAMVNDVNTTVDISGKQSGIYFVRVKTDKGMSVEKIVKQ